MQPSEEDIAWFKSTFRPIPKPALPDDCIEYSIYLITKQFDSNNDSELRPQLREVQKYANELQKQWLKGYIWQRQGFALELSKEDGSSFLRGRTEYGDSIEDEWVVVWLLRELTRKFKDIWAKVTDTDGEFLLIEASGTIPGWLEPEVADNRVWIHDGNLKIIKPSSATRAPKRTQEKLSSKDAFQAILNEPKRIMHSVSIEEEAFYRLRNYPGQIQDNMHHALVTLPRKVAFLLGQRPAYIAPAIEAFYLRDPISLRPLQAKGDFSDLKFPPNDLVTLTVKFPKVGYAQIRSQDFPAPPVWNRAMPSASDAKQYVRANVGMKVTSGFEMLLSDPAHQDKQLVREMKMLLEDLATGDETMPSDLDIIREEQTEDSEEWLDINFDDLEHELGSNTQRAADGKKREFGDKAAQENLQRIVKQFEEFLNTDNEEPREEGMFDDSSELDEDEDSDEDDDESDGGEDKEVSFDAEEFTKMMQEMMGMPPDVMKEIMSGTIDALSENKSGMAPTEVHERARARIQEIDSSEEEDIEDLKQMENELRASGVLDLGSGEHKGRIAQGPHQKDAGEESDEEQSIDDFDGDFARNILQSFRSSGGKGGPAANLMSMMNESTSTSASASASASGSGSGKNKVKPHDRK